MGITISKTSENKNNNGSVINTDVEVEENGRIDNSVHSFTFNITMVFTMAAFVSILIIARFAVAKLRKKYNGNRDNENSA